jgi:hypothetical protein
MAKPPKKEQPSRGADGRFTSKAKANAPNLFLWGFALLVVCLGWVFLYPQMQPIQVAAFAVFLGLSAALVFTAIGGILEIKTKTVKASMGGVAFLLAWSSVMAAGAPEAFASIVSFLGMGKTRR